MGERPLSYEVFVSLDTCQNFGDRKGQQDQECRAQVDAVGT